MSQKIVKEERTVTTTSSQPGQIRIVPGAGMPQPQQQQQTVQPGSVNVQWTEERTTHPDGSVTITRRQNTNGNGEASLNDPEVKMQLEKQKREQGSL